MPKPISKAELLHWSQSNFNKLNELVDSYPIAALESDFPPGTLNRNVRDILAQLHHWHLMLLEWYSIGMSGEKPDMPAKGYTWKTLPALNKKIWATYQEVELDIVREQLNDSYQKVQQIIQQHSNEDLFEKKKYKWTGTTSLAAYLISNTSSHYAWAIKQIKKGMKQQKK